MRLTVIGNLGLLVAAVGAALPARAGVIVQFTSGTDGPGSGFFGQNFTTPSGGPWDDIAFDFLVGGNPEAAGTAYLFTSIYNGDPNGLSSAGAFAVSTGVSGGSYDFAPSVTLQPNTQYFLYEDTFTQDDIGLATGEYFSVGEPDLQFNPSFLESTDFQVDGSVTNAVPEPAALSLTALGGAILLLAGRRRAKIAGSRTGTLLP